MSDLGQDIPALATHVDSSTEEVLRLGAECVLGGDDAWDGLLRRYGVEPLPMEERLQLIAGGMPQQKGALPAEVRAVLNALAKQAGRECARLAEALEAAGGSDATALEATLERLEGRLDRLIDEGVRAHINSVRQKATMGGIFANALGTTANYAAMATAAGTASLRCKTCGAARPGDASDMRTCAYCGGSLFGEDT